MDSLAVASWAKATARTNAVKSSVRVRVEQVFAEQKSRMRLFIRTIARTRAEATILAYNMKRWCWPERRATTYPP